MFFDTDVASLPQAACFVVAEYGIKPLAFWYSRNVSFPVFHILVWHGQKQQNFYRISCKHCIVFMGDYGLFFLCSLFEFVIKILTEVKSAWCFFQSEFIWNKPKNVWKYIRQSKLRAIFLFSLFNGTALADWLVKAWILKSWFVLLALQYYALQILETVIKTRWKILPRNQCEGKTDSQEFPLPLWDKRVIHSSV